MLTRDRSKFLCALSLTLPVALAIACAAEEDEGNNVICVGGKCDGPTDPALFACKDVEDKSGRGTTNTLADLNDPISVFVLRGGSGCPEKYATVMDKLRTEDKTGCDGAEAGISTRLISETGQRDAAENQGFRSVTTRECNNREEHELIFSMLGPTKTRLPSDAEIIGFDPEAKEFNYYTIEGGQWAFHGSSSDFVEGRGDRCNACHTGGGLIMKELHSPWVHWEGHKDHPGARELVDAHEDLGSKRDGINMEGLTRAGNRAWTATRVLNAVNPSRSTVAEMLRPLFCTVELNLDNGADFENTPVDGIPADFLLDPALKSFGDVPVADATYEAAKMAAGMSVRQGSFNKPDTVFKFTFVERGESDVMYVDELEKAGVVDDDFIKDVLAVDFTRPIFSDARCDLLQFAPTFEELGSGSGGTTGGSDDGGSSDGGSGDGGTSDGTSGDPSDSGGSSGGDGGGNVGDCCTAHMPGGCSVDAIEMCVCAQDAFCCDSEWDGQCVTEVAEFMCGSCSMGVADGTDLDLVDDGGPFAAPTAAQIRDGFIAKLQAANPAAGTPAAELLANLMAQGNGAAHQTRVDDFLKACDARDERVFMDDVLRIFQLNADKARSLPVMEFPATMATTNMQPAATAHFDPTTCEVVN